MVMGIPTIKEYKATLEILNDFKETSRTSINYGKS